MIGKHRYKGLQLAQLRSFCLAATEKNFTEAARALGLSKATVWQQVRALERKLGATFLRRRGRAVELTPEGQLLLDKIQPHVNGLDSLERWFALRRTELPQHLSVASIPYLLSYHLRRAIQEFASDHPTIHLNLYSENWSEVIRMVEQGEADLGITPYSKHELPSRSLAYEHLFDLQFCLLTAPNHPLARKKRVRPQDLLPYPLVKPQEGSFSHAALEQLLHQHQLGDQVRWVMVSRSVDMTRTYVALGVGIALEYVGLQAGGLMPDVHIRRFDPDLEPVPVAIVVRKFAHQPAPVLEYRQIVRRFCGTNSPETK